MSATTAITKVDLSQYNIKKIASGKVREIFEIDDKTLLFVATDRISAYDVILNNVSSLVFTFESSLTHLHETCSHWQTCSLYRSSSMTNLVAR